ncbi:hypothetical protein JIG36_02745 [Actinoplanes sp. LDG1-06]|uniref:YNCE-like beta-propeller domain-containing protein n=1 Tax=Paractinoplanes ovalisporus TaxID=2810368 RepID=A0ABS2A3S9_9ACTN|nr:YncE family protein [Actinoplanes ovalisporus]MBM2614477.1 hypothetical protein [Actinoplanes ovalisporus]
MGGNCGMALIKAADNDPWAKKLAEKRNHVPRDVMAPNLYAGSSVLALTAVARASRRGRLIKKAQRLREVFVEGSPTEAVKAAKTFTEKFPDLPEGYAVLAEALLRDRQIEKAVAAADQAESLGLREVPARKLRAVIYEAAGRLRKAITEVDALAEIEDAAIHRKALLARARLKAFTGNRTEALDEATEAIFMENGVDADRIRAYIYHQENELKAAFDDLTCALQFHTDRQADASQRVDIFRYRALISDLRGDHDQATKDRAEARAIAERISPPRPPKPSPPPKRRVRNSIIAPVVVVLALGLGSVVGLRDEIFAPDSVRVGDHPSDVAVSRDGRFVYVANTASGTVSVVNPATRRVTATVPVGGQPLHLRLSPDGRRLYVTRFIEPGLAVVDTSSRKVIRTMLTGRAGELAISRDGRHAYVIEYVTSDLDSSRIAVIDTRLNTVVARITVAAPNGVAVSPDGRRLYVTQLWNETVSVIDTARNKVMRSIHVGSGPTGMAVSKDALYVGGRAEISFVDRARDRVVASISGRRRLTRLIVSGDGRRLYAAGDDSVKIAIADTTSRRVIRNLRAGRSAEGMALSPDGTTLYVADPAKDTVSIIDTGAERAG